MQTIQTLRETEAMHKILGEVEIATIIKKIKGQKLKQVERNYLYRSIRPKLIASAILCEQRILEKINKPKKKITRDIILWNLAKYGYELITPKRINKIKKITIEELIANILIQYPEARLIESIPILIIKNSINQYVLLEAAIKYDLRNKIGYLLETAFIITERLKIKNTFFYLNDLLQYLKNTKTKESAFLGIGADDKEYIEFLQKNSPKRIKEWNLLGRFFDNDFIENAKIYLK